MTLTQQEEEWLQRCDRHEAQSIRNMVADMEPLKEPRRLRVLRSQLPDAVKADVFRSLSQSDTPKFEAWVERALQLPLRNLTPRPKRGPAEVLERARCIMEDEIMGHVVAKREVLCLLSNWLSSNGHSGFALGLEGEPGVGKTSFAKRALAKSIGRPFCFISLGGSSDASGLLGHAYTYEGAVPGRLAECVTAAKTMDPIIFFDELDKISSCSKGEELVHALIHLTDPVQNSHIRDRYFHGIDMDFSRAILVFSYNDSARVHPVLLDRIRRIRLQSPDREGRVQIVNTHMLPRALSLYPSHHIEVDPAVVSMVVDRNMNAPGMRGIEKDLDCVLSSYCLATTLGSAHVLGLNEGDVRVDLAFATAVLGECRERKEHVHLSLYT